MDKNRIDAALIHDYTNDGVDIIVEAYQKGKRIVFFTREPIWDTDETTTKTIKDAQIPTFDRTGNWESAFQQALDFLNEHFGKN